MASRHSINLLAVSAFIPLCLLNACISQRHEVRSVEERNDAASMVVRLQNVAFPLLLTSADWCPFEQELTYGFLLVDRPALGSGGSDNRGAHVVISSVYSRSSAAAVDLRLEDQVLEVNTRDVTNKAAEEVTELVRRLTRARIQPLQLDIERSGRRNRVHLVAVPACQYSLGVIPTEQINGLSNGRQILVTSGLMRLLRSDDELAWVLAHEIAHNVLEHVQKSKLQAMLDALLGATVGTSAAPSAPLSSLEAQADYVGSYIMARAGYDLQAVRQIWQRLRDMHPQASISGQSFERSHPTTDERLAAFEVTVLEIENKRARGELLEPVMTKP